MSQQARHELIHSMAARYQAAGRNEKRRILDECTAASGYHRQYAIQLLNHPPRERQNPCHRPRVRRYDQAVQAALVVVWEAANRICAKRLVPFLPTLLEVLERHGHLQLSEAVRQRLLSISAASVDRLLHEIRHTHSATGSVGGHSAGLLKQQIPIRTFADWENVKPGFFEIDLVVHCGYSPAGNYLHTLVLTDVASGWTECVALWRREQTVVVEALQAIRRRLPIPLLGLDTDNGSEFINHSVIDFCQAAKITLTRSRAYKKNDQCFVEQKNGVVVRRWVGYDRYEGLASCAILAQLYEVLRRYINYFQPSVKRLTKIRTGAKVTKRYEAAQTPCQRWLAAPEVDAQAKAALQAEFQSLDPLALLAEIERLQDALWRMAKPEVRAPSPPPVAPAQANPGEQQAISKAMPDSSEMKPPEPPRLRRQYRRTPRPKKPHDWRTRSDPFAAVSAELQAQLRQHPEITAKTLLAWLQAQYPGQYHDTLLRTLHRRMKIWRQQQAIQTLMPLSQQPAAHPPRLPVLALPQ
jgi:hypothetical protein